MTLTGSTKNVSFMTVVSVLSTVFRSLRIKPISRRDARILEPDLCRLPMTERVIGSTLWKMKYKGSLKLILVGNFFNTSHKEVRDLFDLHEKGQ